MKRTAQPTIPPHDDATPVATFGTSANTVVVCRVCGRTLLMGERSTGFFTRGGDGPYDVCDLCIPRARRFGLQPRPYAPDEVARSRRRSRRKGLAMLGSRLPSLPAFWRREVTARAPLGAPPVGTAAIPVALAVFNQSEHVRTLAGLHKTLGEPRASVMPRSPTDREVVLTAAWEIVWYQFRILPEGDIECTRGTYLSELPARWQNWNCRISASGRVLPPSAEAEVEVEGLPS